MRFREAIFGYGLAFGKEGWNMVQTTGWPAILGVAAALMLAAPLHAAETSTTALTFDSCTDPEGRTITVEANRSQAKLVQTVEFQGEPIIHYNPDALPRLTSEVRLLFFAHECARHALKTAGKASLSAMQARQADCVGLNTLITAGLLQRDALADLQQQMVFSAPEWELLPGPPRTIDVTSCPPARGNVLKLPVATPPSTRQVAWNVCVNTCADRLWHCQKGCRDAACGNCTTTHTQCHAACGAAPEK